MNISIPLFQRGANKVPIYALIVIILVVLLFVFVGNVNTLAPIVTTAFMMTYAAVDYCYFALAMTYDKRQDRDVRYGPPKRKSKGEILNGVVGYGTTGEIDVRPKDSFERVKTDLDKLFPERITQRGQHHHIRESSYHNQNQNHSNVTTPEADFDATKRDKSMDTFSEHSDTSTLLVDKNGCKFLY
jgi:potassium/chloride transporter 8